MSVISTILDTIHLFFIFSPLLFLVISKKTIKPYLKWILLITIMVPLHWIYLENKCILTLLSNKYNKTPTKENDKINVETNDSPFTRKYLKWLYKPIMKYFGMDYNKENDLDMAIQTHWIIIILFVWWWTFFN